MRGGNGTTWIPNDTFLTFIHFITNILEITKSSFGQPDRRNMPQCVVCCQIFNGMADILFQSHTYKSFTIHHFLRSLKWNSFQLYNCIWAMSTFQLDFLFDSNNSHCDKVAFFSDINKPVFSVYRVDSQFTIMATCVDFNTKH